MVTSGLLKEIPLKTTLTTVDDLKVNLHFFFATKSFIRAHLYKHFGELFLFDPHVLGKRTFYPSASLLRRGGVTM